MDWSSYSPSTAWLDVDAFFSFIFLNIHIYIYIYCIYVQYYSRKGGGEENKEKTGNSDLESFLIGFGSAAIPNASS